MRVEKWLNSECQRCFTCKTEHSFDPSDGQQNNNQDDGDDKDTNDNGGVGGGHCKEKDKDRVENMPTTHLLKRFKSQ